jgi:hypothetical protein
VRDGASAFRATVDDGAAPPLVDFVRYTYWAQVRLPPERRLAGPLDVAPPGGVEPVLATQRSDCPQAWSSLSAPLTIVPAPAISPAAFANGEVSIAIVETPPNVSIVVTISGGPRSHPKAIGSYVARIWPRWGDDDIGPAVDVKLNQPVVITPQGTRDIAGHPLTASVRIALIDPLGRIGETAVFTTP